MKDICKAIMNLDKEILLSMIVDEQGNIQCMESKVEHVISKKLENLGGAWSAVVGGVFKQLAQYSGPFEHAIIKHQKATTAGISVKGKYVVFTSAKDVSIELIEKVKKMFAE